MQLFTRFWKSGSGYRRLIGRGGLVFLFFACSLLGLSGCKQQDSEEATTYNNQGVALYSQGGLDDAIANYDKAIALDPGYAEAYSNRGAARYIQGELDDAIADYDQTIALDPEYAPAYVIGQSHLAHPLGLDRQIQTSGRPNLRIWRSKGSEVGRQVRRKHSAPPNAIALAYVRRGYAREGQGDVDGAIADDQLYLELRPDDTFVQERVASLRGKPIDE